MSKEGNRRGTQLSHIDRRRPGKPDVHPNSNSERKLQSLFIFIGKITGASHDSLGRPYIRIEILAGNNRRHSKEAFSLPSRRSNVSLSESGTALVWKPLTQTEEAFEELVGSVVVLQTTPTPTVAGPLDEASFWTPLNQYTQVAESEQMKRSAARFTLPLKANMYQEYLLSDEG